MQDNLRNQSWIRIAFVIIAVAAAAAVGRRVRASTGNQRIEVPFEAAKIDTAAIARRIRATGYNTRIADVNKR